MATLSAFQNFHFYTSSAMSGNLFRHGYYLRLGCIIFHADCIWMSLTHEIVNHPLNCILSHRGCV